MGEAGWGKQNKTWVVGHKIEALAEIGQNRMRGDRGSKTHNKIEHHLCTFPKGDNFTGIKIISTKSIHFELRPFTASN